MDDKLRISLWTQFFLAIDYFYGPLFPVGVEAAEHFTDRVQALAAGGGDGSAQQSGEAWAVAGGPDGVTSEGGGHGSGASGGESPHAGGAAAERAVGTGQRQEVSGGGGGDPVPNWVSFCWQ